MRFRTTNPLIGSNGSLYGQTTIGLQPPYRSTYISEPLAFPLSGVTTSTTNTSGPSLFMSVALLAAGVGFGYILGRMTAKPKRTTNPRKKKKK